MDTVKFGGKCGEFLRFFGPPATGDDVPAVGRILA